MAKPWIKIKVRFIIRSFLFGKQIYKATCYNHRKPIQSKDGYLNYVQRWVDYHIEAEHNIPFLGNDRVWYHCVAQKIVPWTKEDKSVR